MPHLRALMSGKSGGLVAVGALYLAWMAASLSWPLGRDQGIFAEVGDIIVRGGVPYRDSWDVKGPLTHYVFAAAEVGFGRNEWAIRAVDAVALGLSGWALWLTVSTLATRRAATLATAGTMLWHTKGDYWNTAQPDGWGAMLLIAAFWCLTRSHGKYRWAWAAGFGACIGAATWLKFIYIGFFLLALPWLWEESGRKFSKAAVAQIWPVSGLAIVLLCGVGYFWWQGAWDSLIEVTVQYNVLSHSQAAGSTWWTPFAAMKSYVWSQHVLILAPFAMLGLVQLWRDAKSRWLCVSMLIWLAVGLGCVFVQKRFFTYHWLPLHPPLVVCAAIGVDWLWSQPFGAAIRRGRWIKVAAVVLLGTWVYLVGVPARNSIAAWCLWRCGLREDAAYWRRFDVNLDFCASTNREVADFLSAHTTLHDRVLVWGFDSGIYFLADRVPPTRFAFNYPLVKESPFLARYRAEFLADITAHPPAYIVVADHDENNLLPQPSQQTMQEFPEFAAYVADNYEAAPDIGNFHVYHRREDVTKVERPRQEQHAHPGYSVGMPPEILIVTKH